MLSACVLGDEALEYLEMSGLLIVMNDLVAVRDAFLLLVQRGPRFDIVDELALTVMSDRIVSGMALQQPSTTVIDMANWSRDHRSEGHILTTLRAIADTRAAHLPWAKHPDYDEERTG
jgi:hypothetical protein